MILLKLDSRGWPDRLVDWSFNGNAPAGHAVFQDFDALNDWKKKNESLRPENNVTVSAPVPDEVQTWKLREALAVAGLLAQVDTLIAGLPAQQKSVALNRWEYKDTIQRSHPLTLAIGAGLKLTAKQMDDLFIQASGIQ